MCGRSTSRYPSSGRGDLQWDGKPTALERKGGTGWGEVFLRVDKAIAALTHRAKSAAAFRSRIRLPCGFPTIMQN